MGDLIVAVVPARLASTRFPEKPLAVIAGVPMIIRVLRRIALCDRVDRILAATDDDRIRAVVEGEGFEAVMTPSDCPSGTDRVYRAIQIANIGDVRLVVNVQGDEPLIDPVDIEAVIEATLAAGTPMGTLARPLEDLSRFDDPNVVKVVRANDGRALYFSRAPIPHAPHPTQGNTDEAVRPLMHLGLYAYHPSALKRLAESEPSPLEKSERLEQLRALEMGMTIQVAMARSTAPSIAVDIPSDVERVERALAQLDSTRSDHGKA